MKEVVLHAYGVTNSESQKTNNTIISINKIFKDGIGIGGIFHSAIQGLMAWWRIIVKVEVLPLEKSDDIFLPFTAWVNRSANAGDATLEAAENTAVRLGQAKDDMVTASKVAYRFLAGVTSRPSATSKNASNSNNGGSRFPGGWFRNPGSPAAKPSSSTLPEDSSSASSSSSDELPLEHKKLTEQVQSDPGHSA